MEHSPIAAAVTPHTPSHAALQLCLTLALIIQDFEDMDKMEEAPVTRSQPWPAPAPGSQVTSNNGAKPGASLTHLLAGAGINGNNITVVSGQITRENYWLLTSLGVCAQSGGIHRENFYKQYNYP